MTTTVFERAAETAAFLKGKGVGEPVMLAVLSGGISSFADRLEDKVVLNASDIPHFPRATAQGHSGQLVAGTWNGQRIMALKGRFHYYEGHPMEAVTFPTHVAAALGVKHLLVTNAAGGIQKGFAAGDIMLMTDHINMMGVNPLRGIATLKPTHQFTDMTRAYCPVWHQIVKKVASSLGLSIKTGVYMAVSGPSYETPAEIRAFRTLGADAVGMSTVPEVTVANFYGMKVVGLTMIANLAADLHPGGMSHAEVLDEMKKVEPKAVALIEHVVAKVGEYHA